MEGIKGIAEVLEHVLYEVLGLLVPGGVFAFAIAAALGEPWFSQLLSLVEQHPWLSLAGMYVLGYPIQGISRPVTSIFEGLILWPKHLIRKRVRPSINSNLAKLAKWLNSRHGHSGTADAAVDLAELARIYWTHRLGLPDEKRLTPRQVQDLSFSVLLPERKQLDRFRSATSLSRGVSVAVIVSILILVYRLLVGSIPLSASSAAVFIGLIVGYWGLTDRANMYDRLWRSVIPSQFLCAVTRERPLTSAPSDGEVIAAQSKHEPIRRNSV